MTVGELFLESLSSGVITPGELNWITAQQPRFSRVEEATALRLGRLLDQGDIQLGCRLPAAKTRHDAVREQWIEPLGRRRHRRPDHTGMSSVNHTVELSHGGSAVDSSFTTA